MNPAIFMPTVTLQRVSVDINGTQETEFTSFEAIENCEQKIIIMKNGLRTTIYKDSMFTSYISKEEFASSYVLDTLERIGGGVSCFSYKRFVLGYVTNDYDKARFFDDVNKNLEYSHGADAMKGYHLNKTGYWCNTDEYGNELVIDYVRVPATKTHASGYTYKQPKRTNNYPIPNRLAVLPHVVVQPSPPKMSVNDWLNTPMEELMTAEDEALAIQRGIERNAKIHRKGLQHRARLKRASEDKLRFEHWQAQQDKKAADAELHGAQLELI